MVNLALTDHAIALWGIQTRLTWYANRVARAFLWDTIDEGLALQVIEDHAWFVNQRGRFKQPFQGMQDIAIAAFDRACLALHDKHAATFALMCDAAASAYTFGDIAAPANAAAQVARSAFRKPPPSYVGAAVDEAIIRHRIQHARARKRRS